MKYSFIKDNDWLLILTVFLLATFGLVMIFSASYAIGIAETANSDPYHFIKRQIMWFFIATAAFLFVMHVPFRYYRNLSVIIIIISIILLILVKTPGVGHTVGGAERWIRIPGLGVIQPSEFVKLGVIIYLAQVYTQKQAYIDKFLVGVMPPLIMVGVIFGLIMLQPDLGTATSIMAVAMLLAFFSGAKFRHLLGLAIVGVSVFIFFVRSEEYRMQRITGFMDPFADMWGDGYHLVQSYIAIAHGGISGTGLGQGVQKLLYLPEAHTDFILAVVAEELGLLGVIFIFVCYAIIIFRGVVIGTKSRSPFGSLLAFGIVFLMAIQIVFNVGAVTGLLPITGVTLPLVSNGGSSLLVTFIGLAIIANISRNNKRQNRNMENVEEQVPA